MNWHSVCSPSVCDEIIKCTEKKRGIDLSGINRPFFSITLKELSDLIGNYVRKNAAA